MRLGWMRSTSRTVLCLFIAAVGGVVGEGAAVASTQLPRSTPEAQQVDPEAVTSALQSAADLGFVLDMVIVRSGQVVGERAFIGPATTLRQSRSATKSVMSTLIGIAIDQGLISDVDALLVDYLPAQLVPSDPMKRRITVRHLLTMTSGLQWDEDAEVVDWLYGVDPVGDILSRPMAAEPGTVYNYSTAACHLLSVVLSEATGMSTLGYADAYLFAPLGITDRSWVVTGGYENGGHGLFVSTEDLAKLGVLFVDGGRWDGRQLVSRWWVNRSTWPEVVGFGEFGPLSDIRYGWLWWLDRDAGYEIHTAWGWGGQFVFCVPELELVVAAHSISSVDGATANQQEAAVLSIIVDEILPGVADRRVFTATGREVPELAAVDRMMEDLIKEHRISNATAAVVKDGRLVLARGYSWGQPGDPVVEPTALFRTGSVAKAFTSIGMHQLMQSGQLGYDSRAADLVHIEPMHGFELDPRFADVTVDHLLTHTSGMYSADNVYRVSAVVAEALGSEMPCTGDEILSYILAKPFLFEPGTDWDYNNYGYLMLEEMARASGGEALTRHVDREVFRAAGVGRARPAHMLESELAPTEVHYDGLEGDPYRSPVEAAVAAGGWVVSAPDMARVFSTLFDRPDGEGLLRDAWREQMLELPFPISQELGYGRGWIAESFFTDQGHTVGWLTDPDDGLEVHAHGGGGTGVHTLGLWRSDNVVFVMFTNKDPVAEDLPFPEIQSWPTHDLWSSVGIVDGVEPAAPTESWIPIVARSEGVAGSRWRSDVGLLNRSPLANRVRLRMVRDGVAEDVELELAPGEQRVFHDVLASFETDESGPLRVFSSEPLGVSSRTYNESADGSFGQYLAGTAALRTLATGDEVVLTQLVENDAARSNIGLFNGWKRSAVIRVELRDGDGEVLATIDQEVAPETTVQLNRPFQAHGGRSDIAAGYAVIRVLFGQQVIVYGSVVDNLTNDPTTVPMAEPGGDRLHWIAAAAHAAGVADSQWRTDVAVLNLNDQQAAVRVSFTGDDGVASAQDVVVSPGGQTMLVDVVEALGRDGSGWLEIAADRPVLVSSRSYNQTAAGSFGQFLAGVAEDELMREGESRHLGQLAENDDFRTNIGLLNTSNAEALVRLSLMDGTGQLVATPSRRLAPGQRVQLQAPFAAAGRSDVTAGYAVVELRAGSGVVAYASMIDNHSNDPTTMPARR